MHAPQRRHRRLWLAIASGLAASLVGTAAWMGWGARRVEVWYWSGRLTESAADDLQPPVQALARYGSPGLRIVIPMLDSPDWHRGAAVEHALVEALQSIEQLSPQRAMTARLTFASELCEALPKMRPSGRRRAVRLAVRLLSNAGHDASGQRTELTIVCQRILQSARESPLEQTDVASVSSTEVEPAERHRLSTQPSEPPVELTGSSISVEVTDESPTIAQTAADDSASAEPRLLKPLPRQQAPPLLPQAAPPVAELPPVRSLANMPAETRSLADSVQPSGNAMPVTSDAAEPVPTPAPMACLSMLAVIRELRSAAPGRAATAERTLKGRGLSPLELELGRKLSDPDVASRERLAYALPSLPGVDARTWLAWLATDEHPQVRRAAYSVMATIPDAELFQRITDAAQHDGDPSIRLLANELLRKRRQNATPVGL